VNGRPSTQEAEQLVSAGGREALRLVKDARDLLDLEVGVATRSAVEKLCEAVEARRMNVAIVSAKVVFTPRAALRLLASVDWRSICMATNRQALESLNSKERSALEWFYADDPSGAWAPSLDTMRRLADRGLVFFTERGSVPGIEETAAGAGAFEAGSRTGAKRRRGRR